MNRLLSLWLALRSGLWFVPTLMVLASIGLALALIEVQPLLQQDLSASWPRLFGAGAEGARGMLSAIATSMVTVAGVVFSVTIVALAQASSQYSPRVLRNFMSDRPTQVVLGAFVAVFTYCLIVLRTIRGAEEGSFVPSLAVLGGVVMAFVGIALLIYFIHHVATAIQVSFIVSRIARDTRDAIDRLFPSEVGEPAGEGAAPPLDERDEGGASIPVPRTGYVLAVDADRLLALAVRHDLVLRVRPRVGDFVIEGEPLLDAAPLQRLQRPAADTLQRCVVIADERDVHQDAAYGLQQLVDIALKALSASVNDPTTAVGCIDHLGALLLRAAQRGEPRPWRHHDGRLRLVAHGASYAELVVLGLSPLTHHAGGHASVHERLLDQLERLVGAVGDPWRRLVLVQRLEAHRERLAECDLPSEVSLRLRRRIEELLRRLAAPSPSGGRRSGQAPATDATPS